MEHARPLRILCQSGQDLSLTVRDGTAVLARADDKDQRQVVRRAAPPILRSCLKLMFGFCSGRQRGVPHTSVCLP